MLSALLVILEPDVEPPLTLLEDALDLGQNLLVAVLPVTVLVVDDRRGIERRGPLLAGHFVDKTAAVEERNGQIDYFGEHHLERLTVDRAHREVGIVLSKLVVDLLQQLGNGRPGEQSGLFLFTRPILDQFTYQVQEGNFMHVLRLVLALVDVALEDLALDVPELLLRHGYALPLRMDGLDTLELL